MELLTSYVDILQKEWGKRFLWLDAGDEFQGGFESKLTEGKIMTDIFNQIGLSAGTFGNHEFDDGIDLLKAHVKNASYPYITSNIYTKGSDFENTSLGQIPFKTFEIGNIKIGVFGITTLETLITTKGDLSGYDFKDYKDIIDYYSRLLRRVYRVKAVILLSHAGIHCQNPSDVKDLLELKLWDKYNSNQGKEACQATGEIVDLLNDKDKVANQIDLIIAGHTHENSHFFFNGVPVVSSVNNAKYANVVYLSFYRNKLQKDKTVIEGPLPVCSKVFSKNKICSFTLEEGETYLDYGSLEEFQFHGVTVKKNEKTTKIIDGYSSYLGEKANQVIFFNSAFMETNRYKETLLGNFITDVEKEMTGADIAILNSGFFRKNWNIGNITVKDLFEMFPFSNEATSFEMTGEEVVRMVKEVQYGTGHIFQSSGLIQFMKIDPDQGRIVEKVTLSDGNELDPNKVYKIASIDFNIPLYMGSFSRITNWYPEPRNLGKFGDFNDKMTKALSKITNLDPSKHYDINNLRVRYTN